MVSRWAAIGRDWGRRAGAGLALAGLVAIAGLSLNRIYSGMLLAGLVAGAAAGSVLGSLLLRRASAGLGLLTSVAALGGYSLLAVGVSARAAAVPGHWAELWVDAARGAVPRMLTALIPVEPQPDTVFGPVVLAWLAGWAGAELIGRAGRPAGALVPPAGLYAASLVAVGPNAPAAIVLTMIFIVAAAVLLALTRPREPGQKPRATPAGRRSRWRSVGAMRRAAVAAAGMVGLVVAAGLAAALAPGLVRGLPSDPRDRVSVPSLDVLDQNPLSRISGWAADPDQHLFDVEIVSGAGGTEPPPQPAATAPDDQADPEAVAAPGEFAQDRAVESTVDKPVHDTRLRLAVLSDWDGVTWRGQASYRGAGRVLPAPEPPPGSSGPGTGAPPLTIVERITVQGLAGRLLPAAGQAQRIEGVRVAYDRSSGSLLHTAPLSPGTAYSVTSMAPAIDVNLLPVADVPAGPDVARYLSVGATVPPDLSDLATRIAAGTGTPYLRARALEAFLADHYEYAADAPSGHAYPNLRFFLLGDPRAGGRRGTSEQFAAAFAALGRLMGLPTRVVVGFTTPAGGGPVRAADALAWPEVLFAGAGWVAFDPLPRPGARPQPIEDDFLVRPPPATEPPASVEPPDAPPWTPPPAEPSLAAPAPGGPGGGAIAGSVGGGLAAALLLAGAGLLLLRLLLRRSRARAAPPGRVLGAWAEVNDALVLAGAAPAPHLTVAEVAEQAVRVAKRSPGAKHAKRSLPPIPSLSGLAAEVNAVGFAGATVHEIDEQAAADAWASAVAYTRALRARRPWWRRVLWRIDPRPLRSRSRKPGHRPLSGGCRFRGRERAGYPNIGHLR